MLCYFALDLFGDLNLLYDFRHLRFGVLPLDLARVVNLDVLYNRHLVLLILTENRHFPILYMFVFL